MPRFDGRWFPSSNTSDWAAGKFGSPGWYPATPTIDTATEGDQSVVLEWTAASANGLDITGYQIEKNDGSWSVAVANTGSASGSHTVTGLTNGTAYTFRIKAINSLGVSENPSVVSASKTPRGVPVGPTGLTLAAHASLPWSKMELSWTAGSANGSAITGYKIQRKTGSGGTYADVTANTGNTNVTYTDTGLTEDTTYYYRVAGINVAGTGSYSTEANRDTAEAVWDYSQSGGTVRTYTDSGTAYTSITWTGSGSLTIQANPDNIQCQVMVVAGGGCGGNVAYNGMGSGGAAGGCRVLTGITIPDGSHTITVGGGGSAYSNSSSNYQSSNASNSKIDWASGTDIEATRGGAGKGSATTLSPSTPQSGGSGAGGGDGALTGASGNTGGYSPVEGYGGGNGSTAYYKTSGASGGAGGAGSTANGYSQPWGASGIYNYYQTGSSGSTDGVHKFAGAGHGTGTNYSNPYENSNNNYGGGKSGTQNGVYNNCSAIANTGGGGGAGSYYAQGTYYFNGGSGIVTIRWPTP
jgi:hypothetical protein